jgi:hypothetical protein
MAAQPGGTASGGEDQEERKRSRMHFSFAILQYLQLVVSAPAGAVLSIRARIRGAKN